MHHPCISSNFTDAFKKRVTFKGKFGTGWGLEFDLKSVNEENHLFLLKQLYKKSMLALKQVEVGVVVIILDRETIPNVNFLFMTI